MKKKPTKKDSKTIVKKQKNGDVVIIKKKPTKKKYVPVPPKEHQFKKGQVANPHGCNGKIKRAINKFNSQEISKAINIVMTSTEEEVVETLNDKETTLGFKTILRAMLDASQNGDYSKFYQIAEHVIGKIPNKVELASNVSLGQKMEDKEKLKSILKAIEGEF